MRRHYGTERLFSLVYLISGTFFAIWSNCASASAIHFCKAIKFSPMLLSSTTVRLLKTKSAVRAPPPPLVEVPPQLKLKAVGPTLVFLFFFLLPMTVTVQVVFFYFFCSFPLLQSPLATENVWFCVDLQPRYGCSRPTAPYAVGGSAAAG